MARMHPSPFPPHLASDPRRRAERIVYESFMSGLSRQYHVFYSVPWLTQRAEGEDDFLVVHPKRGILVTEVKGGEIQRDGQTGQWYSVQRARQKRHKIKDPVEQLRKNVYALKDLLENIPVFRGSRPRIVHLAI